MSESEQDDRLAVWTDRLLSHPQPKEVQAMTSEERMVLKLQALIRPDEPINPRFRQNLTLRLNEEWDKTHAHHPVRRRRRQAPTSRNLYLMAAALVAVLLGMIAIFNASGVGVTSEDTTGTAEGSLPLFIALMVLGLVVAGVAWWWSKRR